MDLDKFHKPTFIKHFSSLQLDTGKYFKNALVEFIVKTAL